MPIRDRAVLVLAAATVAMSACSSDSTGPKGLTDAQLAAHYDSLAVALMAGGTLPDSDMSEDVALFNGIIADGQSPSTITVTVGGQQQQWYGNFVNFVDSAGTDSLEIVDMWKDLQADAFVGLILEDAQGSNNAPGVIALGGDYLTDSVDTYTASFSEASGTCAFTPITDVTTAFGLPTYGATGFTCNPSTASIQGTLISGQGDATASAAYDSFAFGTQTIKGVRLQLTSSNAQHTVRGLRALLAAHPGSVFLSRR
jgi:hypothetical protein